LQRAADGCDGAGRPLFAANRDLDWPDEPHLALWHAVTLLREHRGDGHVAALTMAGLDPCEAHVTQVAASGASPDTIRPYRGWSDEDWGAAVERLRTRGWLDADGRLTPEGAAGRDRVEDDTDRLAGELTDRLGAEATERLMALLTPSPAGWPRPARSPTPTRSVCRGRRPEPQSPPLPVRRRRR
jgi:hypothetical protein